MEETSRDDTDHSHHPAELLDVDVNRIGTITVVYLCEKCNTVVTAGGRWDDHIHEERDGETGELL